MDKYKVVKYWDIKNINKWFHECEKVPNHPYILVRTKKKYAQVEYDHISMEYKYDDWISNCSIGGNILSKKNIETFKKYACKKSKYSISNHIITFYNILIEDAEGLASELYDNIKNVIDKYKGATK